MRSSSDCRGEVDRAVERLGDAVQPHLEISECCAGEMELLQLGRHIVAVHVGDLGTEGRVYLLADRRVLLRHRVVDPALRLELIDDVRARISIHLPHEDGVDPASALDAVQLQSRAARSTTTFVRGGSGRNGLDGATAGDERESERDEAETELFHDILREFRNSCIQPGMNPEFCASHFTYQQYCQERSGIIQDMN